ncbi:MAG: 3-hydroxyacyl-ACP dehydratase FabZ family protein [Phycisphaerales bacterium]
MHFDLVDHIVEIGEGRIVTLKQVSAAEEYLLDHFPSFPVLPGVLMLEAMVQAARRLLVQTLPDADRFVLGVARNIKYGSFVRPGDTLKVEVTIPTSTPDAEGAVDCRGQCMVLRPGEPSDAARVSISGRFSVRPPRL